MLRTPPFPAFDAEGFFFAPTHLTPRDFFPLFFFFPCRTVQGKEFLQPSVCYHFYGPFFLLCVSEPCLPLPPQAVHDGQPLHSTSSLTCPSFQAQASPGFSRKPMSTCIRRIQAYGRPPCGSLQLFSLDFSATFVFCASPSYVASHLFEQAPP